MKIIQLNKDKNDLTITSTAIKVHIGVEHFHSTPLTITNTSTLYKVNINNEPYIINECDILEFDNLTGTITATPANGWDNNTFINIAYEDATVSS